MCSRVRVVLVLVIPALLLLLPMCCGGEKIRVLVAGQVEALANIRRFFDSEPAVIYHAVPARDPGGTFGFRQADLVRMIRLYFPRTYEDLKTFDVLILTSPEYYLFTPKQDQWMYEAITEGMGGINDLGVFGIVSGIAQSWSNSIAQLAFPNDAPAVTAKACGEALTPIFKVIINRDASFPILTPFIPFGVEDIPAYGGAYMVIHREGSEVLAWQLGDFGPAKVDYMAAWEYESGRTITNANGMCVCWQGYPTTPQDNQYSPDILMNIVYWLAQRELIEDIAVFHRIKSSFTEYRSRMSILISLMEFIDKFGANTQRIQEEVTVLGDLYDRAAAHYLDQEFLECETALLDGIKRFPKAEDVARKEKDKALFWAYVVEWLVTASTLFLSGFVLWSLMVRRRLYREIDATRLTAR